jgi:hypothetical protein
MQARFLRKLVRAAAVSIVVAVFNEPVLRVAAHALGGGLFVHGIPAQGCARTLTPQADVRNRDGRDHLGSCALQPSCLDLG